MCRNHVRVDRRCWNTTYLRVSLQDRIETREKDVDDGHATDEFTRLEERAADSGMEIAVDRVNGHWRAGFLTTDELGEAVFVLHATGPDRATAIRNLAELCG